MRKQVRENLPHQTEGWMAEWTAQWMDGWAPGKNFTWYSRDNRTAREHLLPHLRLLNQTHCCFCDTYPVEDSTTEPIEHWRPKGDEEHAGYGYTWTNLYYSCNRCQACKGALWELALIQPDTEDYAFETFFEFDFETGVISPNAVAHDDVKHRAARTIAIYGLNEASRPYYRRLALRKWVATAPHEQIINDFAYRNFIEGGSQN